MLIQYSKEKTFSLRKEILVLQSVKRKITGLKGDSRLMQIEGLIFTA